jgi:NAD(P)-dependent dehydrogenase (short-subunit alcohol dehydrogenase family)
MGTRLAGKVAVITGGSSGIGLATGERFAAEGAKVVIGDVDKANGDQIAGELGGSFVEVDVTNQEQVEALFATAKNTYGSVDIAFNNAGISPPTTTRSSTPAWTRGAGCRRSTSPRCTYAARRSCRTCSSRRKARSSTPPRSSR